MMMNTQRHPLTDYPEVEKVDYLSIVASIAAADGKVTDDEITRIREFCEAIDIGEIGVGMIIAVVGDPSLIALEPILTRLAKSDLRFTLLTDMFFMAYADGVFAPGEEEEIRKIVALLDITQKQIDAINTYVEAVFSAQSSDQAKSDRKRLGSEIAGILASAGVPLGAVAIAGTVFGDGIATGLLALGMGLGTAAGVGVAVSLGVSSYFGIRWLFKKIVGEE